MTLTEILVVIAILAILTALLLPTANLVRANAKTVTCANAQRQVVMGCHTYALDREGALPATRVSNNYWFILIGDYYYCVIKLNNTTCVCQAGAEEP